MPTVESEKITGLAFCIDGRCPGYEQRPVEAIKRTSEFSYRELGGDIPGTERSTVAVVFADEADAVCEYCQKPRLVSDQTRPEYDNVSGRDPLEIFHRGQAASQMRELVGSQENERLKRELENEQLKTRLAEQDARMEQMHALMERQNAMLEKFATPTPVEKRGPGRPRKETVE